MARHFYAISWTYGANTYDSRTETRLGTYHRFDDRDSRDRWVADGSPYVSQPGAREAIPSSDRELRQLLSKAVKIDASLREVGIQDDGYYPTDAERQAESDRLAEEEARYHGAL